jgi:hypothetical protein
MIYEKLKHSPKFSNIRGRMPGIINAGAVGRTLYDNSHVFGPLKSTTLSVFVRHYTRRFQHNHQ